MSFSIGRYWSEEKVNLHQYQFSSFFERLVLVISHTNFWSHVVPVCGFSKLLHLMPTSFSRRSLFLNFYIFLLGQVHCCCSSVKYFKSSIVSSTYLFRIIDRLFSNKTSCTVQLLFNSWIKRCIMTDGDWGPSTIDLNLVRTWASGILSWVSVLQQCSSAFTLVFNPFEKRKSFGQKPNFSFYYIRWGKCGRHMSN